MASAKSLSEMRRTTGGDAAAPAPSTALVEQPLAMAVSAVETASAGVAAKAKALAEARYVMALRQPRVWDAVRQDLLGECKRPSFARNKSALYNKPIGGGVEGLGIRFVEVALRCMKNVSVDVSQVYEDDQKEIHSVVVVDLEANVPYSQDVRVSKTVERSFPSDDGSYVSVRKNSKGKPVYTVIGTEDDILNKRQALISKAVRTLGLRVIPGDLQDEAEAIIRKIRLDDAARDPDAERKAIIDAFGELGVPATDLIEYIGHDIATCTPKELVDLRGVYAAIRDGEATWAQAREQAANRPGAKAPSTDAKKPAAEGAGDAAEKDKGAAAAAGATGATGAAPTDAPQPDANKSDAPVEQKKAPAPAEQPIERKPVDTGLFGNVE